MQPVWMEWDPATGQSFAVVWHNGGADAALSFHDASKGRLLTFVDLAKHLWPAPDSGRLCYEWAPSGKCIVAYGWECTQDGNGIRLDGKLPQAVIIRNDGLCCRLDIDAPTARFSERFEAVFEVAWSPCRYLQLKLRRHQPGSFHAGFIWDAMLETYVLTWERQTSPFHVPIVVWSAPPKQGTERTTCFVAGCNNADGTLLLLPSPSSSSNPQQLPMHPHFEEMCWPPCSVSPCGNLVVSESPPIHSDRADVDGPHRCLEHTEIVGAHNETVQAHAGLIFRAVRQYHFWHFGSVAWHPCPASGRMYAIVQQEGTVCLMDGRRHKLLRSWSLAELVGCAALDEITTSEMRLRWSPCGSQLIVTGPDLTTFLCFD